MNASLGEHKNRLCVINPSAMTDGHGPSPNLLCNMYFCGFESRSEHVIGIRKRTHLEFSLRIGGGYMASK